MMWDSVSNKHGSDKMDVKFASNMSVLHVCSKTSQNANSKLRPLC